MRTYRLARAAVEAERLRLGLYVRRSMGRLVLAVIALVWLAAALACIHAALFLWLAPLWGEIRAFLALAGLDLVFAVALILLAWRRKPGATERDAKAIRDSAWRETVRALTIMGMLEPLIRLAFGQIRRFRR